MNFLYEDWQCECGVTVRPADAGVCPCGMLHPDHPLADEDDGYDYGYEDDEALSY